ncbi:MAG: hypothetical protein JXA54_02020 [Candidatus Heimdallarchaeota archaeon]|nr:hypothetical protein [Candidatus Heimdallarchaeota archaeon]
MFPRSFTETEIKKFLAELLDDELAINIYLQLLEDGGNTAFGLSDNLKSKNLKASKTRVYEEIAKLVNLGLIQRVSNRPPIYTILNSKEDLESIAIKLLMNSREKILRTWASSYPFLPDNMKNSDSKIGQLTGGQFINFNPYPIVDIFNIDLEGLKRYMLRVFESKNILISNTIVDTMFEANNFNKVFQNENFKLLIKQFTETTNRFGRISVRTLSTYFSKDIQLLRSLKELNPFNKQFFNIMDYELREPVDSLSSFILGDNNLFYPIGVGGIVKKTSAIIEIRNPEIIESAKLSFENAWKKAKIILKIENGEIIHR